MKRKRTKTNCSNKKKKLFDQSRSSLTQFDDVSTELLYEIFDYLDHYDLYQSFFNFNQRIQNLLVHSILPIRINISTLSKSNFEEYYQTIIKVNHHRITSLNLSDVFIIEMFFSPTEFISQLIRLESLILDHIESNHLEKILECGVSLPNLRSLTIHPINYVENSHEIYSQIFCLSHLKYCKIIGHQMSDCQMPLNTNDQFSPIEYLVIDDGLEFDYFDYFLSYVPQLRYFFLGCLNGAWSKRTELNLIRLNHLRYISIELHQVYFNQFEHLIKNTFHHIEEFHLTAGRDQTYVDAKRWEELISIHLFNLRVFDLNYHGSIYGHDQLSKDEISKNFHSLFWIERKTLFIYQNRDSGNTTKIFYYNDRKMNYRLLKIDDTTSVNSFQEKLLVNSIDRIVIKSKKALETCQNYFPNVTTLILDHNLSYVYSSFTTDLNRIIPLSQITKLIVESDCIYERLLIDILRLTPHVHTLKWHSSSFEQNENFLFVSKNNKIKNVDLIGYCPREYCQNIVMFFPRAEKLKIGIGRKELNSFILFLFSKSNENTCRLFSLGITMVPKVCVREVKKLIKSEKLLPHYSIKHIDRNLYLWW